MGQLYESSPESHLLLPQSPVHKFVVTVQLPLPQAPTLQRSPVLQVVASGKLL